jgi:putative dimethyl sulfoxide reductase chaperone
LVSPPTSAQEKNLPGQIAQDAFQRARPVISIAGDKKSWLKIIPGSFMENRRRDLLRMDDLSEKISMKELTKVHQFREMLYLFLSKSFSKEVDSLFLQSVYEVSKSLKASFKEAEEGPLSRGIEFLARFCEEARRADEEAVLGDLARDYAALFLGVGPENVALCESAYRTERGLLFQGPYFDILERYKEAGLGKRDDFSEPEDHLSLELVYMAHLSRRTLSSAETGNEQDAERDCRYQSHFLKEHLLQWVPRFSKGLSEISPSAFYKALAHLLEGYLKMDVEFLDSLLLTSPADPISAKKSTGPERRGAGAKRKKTGK